VGAGRTRTTAATPARDVGLVLAVCALHTRAAAAQSPVITNATHSVGEFVLLLDTPPKGSVVEQSHSLSGLSLCCG